MANDEYKLKNRTKRLDRIIDGEPAPKKKKEAPKADPESGDDYDKDFEVEATIAELKKKKEELLKGISGKSEEEKEKIREELRQINDDIMDLENS